MKWMTEPRRLLIILTGGLFAAYSAYNVFIIIRNGSTLPSEGILISAVVALLFAVLAAFVWTGGVKGVKHVRFMSVRRFAFIFALLAIFALKLRMVDRVFVYIDTESPQTILYAVSYFMTLAALLILFVYYTFIVRDLPFYPRAASALPYTAMILFLCCLILEAILFFGYGVNLEASALRTVVIRPVFYLGFIGLAAHFLYPLRPLSPANKKDKQDVKPQTESVTA